MLPQSLSDCKSSERPRTHFDLVDYLTGDGLGMGECLCDIVDGTDVSETQQSIALTQMVD